MNRRMFAILPVPQHGVLRRRRAHCGFTFIELILGLLVTSLVLGAVASLALAMGTAWRRCNDLESLTLRARQAGVRISDEVRNGKLLCASQSGSLDGSSSTGAAVLIWTSDTNADGKIQGAELTLIEHDPATHKLMIYRSGQGDTVTELPWATVIDPMVIADFKKGRSGVPLAGDVRSALFATSSTTSATQSPTLEFALSFQRSDGLSPLIETGTREIYTEYGSCVVRAPLQKPS